ncbi:hypothetical protein ACFOKI_16355 [Sphingomonas qilianensis]|uniref:Uncharacterized protein n=1 Tax=Sphingomonas qilianensis TaxID=1736690 RepID=A0ABU9XWM6_9SPHN
MNKVFEHFHLNLVQKPQQDLLSKPQNRETSIRFIFSERFQFQHLNKAFHWVPHGDQSGMILGTVEREKARTQRRAPEEGAGEFQGVEWQGSIVIIDPVHQPDGQKLAFERDRDVGQPNAILDSLVSHFNEQQEPPYTIVIRSLFDAETFRAFAKRHGELVEYVNFSFVVPNMFFGTTTGVDQGLRRIGDSTGAQTVDLRLQSEEGVKTNSEDVQDTILYAESGNASVTSKAMN